MSFKSFCRSLKRAVCNPVKKMCAKLVRRSPSVAVPIEASAKLVDIAAKQQRIAYLEAALILKIQAINFLSDYDAYSQYIQRQQQQLQRQHKEPKEQVASASSSFIDLTKKFKDASEIYTEMKRLAQCYNDEEELPFVSKVFPPATPSAINKLMCFKPVQTFAILVDLRVGIPRSLITMKLPSRELIRYVPPKVYSDIRQPIMNFLNLSLLTYNAEQKQLDVKNECSDKDVKICNSIIICPLIPVLSL